jgi:hypothetical protein
MSYEEDTDPKVRRNLVVASALILLVTWLELPVAAITEKALTASNEIHVKPFRIWATCFAVLVYLGLRYRFTKEWEILPRYFLNASTRVASDLTYKLLERKLRKFHKTGIEDQVFLGILQNTYSHFQPNWNETANERPCIDHYQRLAIKHCLFR